MALILELAGHGPDLIQVTAQYSNAVLLALLPYFSDAAHKLDLPVPHPLTTQHVIQCRVMPYRYPNGDWVGGGVEVQGGWSFGFAQGYVNLVQSRHSYFTLQDPGEVPKFYGIVRMSQAEAVQMARSTLVKLGIPLESVFAEQESRVTPPEKVGNNMVPHYRVQWLDPRSGGESVDIEVNADAKRIERVRLSVNPNLRKPPPKVGVVPPLRGPPRPRANPEYAWKLLPIVLNAVDDYGKTLGLPIPRPLTTNQVARFSVSDNGGWPHSEIELTNGWEFVYRNSMVNGFYAPDNLFHSSDRPMLAKDFVGKWNLTEAQAVQLVRGTLARLNYPTNLLHVDFKPDVHKPAVLGIPRFAIEWAYTPESLQSNVEAEVDAEKGSLKSLYFDNMALWNHPPPIDLPISLRQSRATNPPPRERSASPPTRKVPQRPPPAFNAPKPK
ncbi:MAG: hypothetical protein HZA90_02680 [Verrucomicrobia bacterium]|nr:hypothetical protein [Verrucomicrobiota bacterium]